MADDKNSDTMTLRPMLFFSQSKDVLASAVLPAFITLIASLLGGNVQAQHSSSEIYQKVKKLSVLGNVLYLAAHPDDENTRFISWCANDQLFNTHYLSLTRGDGGQNLIGTELREELGIIRTQELLAARRLDGGTQSFSRANDFGYSKTADETLRIWNHQQVLADVVWTVRKLRPDVIVCRFPPDSRGGHGHHTASAMLGIEAFNMAADPAAFPDQLAQVEVWQPLRIVTNTGRWWNADISADEPGVVTEDVGTYLPVVGKSIGEMAALSRSQHRSQGFGSTGVRGSLPEYFEHLEGVEAQGSLFDGMASDWSRVNGGDGAQKLADDVKQGFSFADPAASVPALLKLRDEIKLLKDAFWRQVKITEVEGLIHDCLGLHLEARAYGHSGVPGDSVGVVFELINRSKRSVQLTSILSEMPLDMRGQMGLLPPNSVTEVKATFRLPMDSRISQPYWLENEGTTGMYAVDDLSLVIQPDNQPAVSFDIDIAVDGRPVTYQVPLRYRWNDPVTGENHRPFVITPPVVLGFSESLLIAKDDAKNTLTLQISAMTDNVEGEVLLRVPTGWEVNPTRMSVRLEKKGDEQSVKVSVKANGVVSGGVLCASFESKSGTYDRDMRTITYEHIPTQVHFPRAETKLTFIDLKGVSGRLGYIQGAGDAVADGLRSIGFEVDELMEADLIPGNLARYRAVILGIRFLNVNERAQYILPKLLDFVRGGGNLIIQYNTSRGLEINGLSPYSIRLGRDRVTEEDAEVTVLLSDHPALISPNRIAAADFDGWVQERGLYFPSEWDASFAAPLRMNDTGELPKDGSLLIAQHGKGHFIYTGLSLFRQLPAGVPGAYRLLVNLIRLPQND